ncbi:MAG: CDP-diacylglycerol--glycerol-3-phosphate 3-phosphatidyltransferase, partial [Mameliella sp.]|nr:CDP-diacylglycerol--glycerol-3-phosphate 3-phosphatidyltransferase [Mameliella sp.]
KVTKRAKWKTTAQMVAIAVLFAQGVFEHYLVMSSMGMDDQIIGQILDGEIEDEMGLRWKLQGMIWSGKGGLTLLWIAAALTLITGWDYFRKALPFLKEDR